MAIKKRTNIPDPTLSLQADFSPDDPMAGRSADLQGQRYEVWQFIQNNPHCTREDVARGLGLKSSTATARIKELIDLAYVVEPPGLRKTNRSGVRAKVLMLSDRKAGGRTNDRVRVEVRLTIDCNGNYGASAHVINGHKQTGAVTTILRKPMTLTAPPTDAYAASLDDSPVAPVTRLDLQLDADQIIDADFTIVEVD